jgi:hypothetical protein
VSEKKKYRCMTRIPASKENIVADTAKPPPAPGHPLARVGEARVEMSALLRQLKRLRIV